MSATTEQETPQAEQEPTNAEPTIEQRLEHLEGSFAEQIFAALRDEIRVKILRERVARLERHDREHREQAAPIYGELVTSSSDNTHVRIQTTKNSRGYSFETVVAVDGADSADVRDRAEQLLHETNDVARDECARLEWADQNPAAVAAQAALDARRSMLDESSGDEPDVSR